MGRENGLCKAQSRKEVRIFWNRRKRGRGQQGQVGDEFGETVIR